MLKILLAKFFDVELELTVTLGSEIQKGTLFAAIPTIEVWKKETLKKKIKSFLRLKWEPTQEIVAKLAEKVFRNDIFGMKEDYGEELYNLNGWINSHKWDFRS